jgi:chemosensory pili system protein ChpA (sensor histidine kinase/response regulator)
LKDPNAELIEIFLQEASDRLQYLREYSGVLLDVYPPAGELERLYIAAHTLAGTSASYGFALFSEVAGRLAHVFQYAMNATIAADAAVPLLEFIREAVALLESDLIMISTNSVEATDDVDAFKQRYPFAFQSPRARQEPEFVTEEPELVTEEPELVTESELVAEERAIVAEDPLLMKDERPAAAEDLEIVPDQNWEELPRAEEFRAEPLLETAPVAIVPEQRKPERELATEPEPERELELEAESEPELQPETPSEPEPEVAIAPETDDLPADEAVPAEILEFFVPEAEEHLQAVTHCLLALETNPGPEEVHRLLRSMHTIKGSAAQVGLHRISKVAHRTEDLITRLRDGELQPSAEIIDICLESVDILKKFLHREWKDDSEMYGAVGAFFSHVARLMAAETPHSAETTGAVVQKEAVAREETPRGETRRFSPEEEALLAEYALARQLAAEASKAEPAPKSDDEPARREVASAAPHLKSVRVDLERLDSMMNSVGELVINRTQLLGRLAELERLAEVLTFSKTRMMEKVAEFQEKYEFGRLHSINALSGLDNTLHRGGNAGFTRMLDQSLAEFSELEMDRYDDFSILSRSLTEISADISEVLNQLDGFVRRVNSDIDSFTKVAHRLQDEITGARMVPIGNLYTRLTRTVRDAAKAAGKQVDLALEGAETELDNNIVQRISDPLIHLVRNAVAHGIERDEERYQCGKNSTGNIAVRASHRGNHIYIEVEDDGRGIDYERVRKTAVDNGLVYPEAAPDLTEDELLELLFQPGFSTAPRKTELAGRGVGLDVVRSNLAQLKGEIEIRSEKGQGTLFTLKVPLTLIISQALFVRCGATMFAIPVTVIEEIRRVREEEIEQNEGRLRTRVRDAVIEAVRVDTTLGLEPVQPVNGYYRMVIVHTAGRAVGLIVEDVVRKDEIVVKSLGEYLRRIKMFPGATIAPDGSLILVIDVNRLVAGEAMEHTPMPVAASAARVFAPGAEAVAQNAIPQAAIEIVDREKVIVLADDSISVRKFVGRMLEKAGYRVLLACDGLEALEIVGRMPCDLVVTDLEMPHANGYELLSHLRQAPATRNIPVMIVTSRAGAKHRERAMKEGASAFLTKPVQEEQFLSAVGRLIGSSAEKPAANILAEQ